jgi:hypothetical protein
MGTKEMKQIEEIKSKIESNFLEPQKAHHFWHFAINTPVSNDEVLSRCDRRH